MRKRTLWLSGFWMLLHNPTGYRFSNSGILSEDNIQQ